MFQTLTDEGQNLLKTLGGDAVGATWTWKRPKECSHGDLTTTVALELARAMKQPPRTIAEGLMGKLRGHADIERIDVAGSGYINVWLKPMALLRELELTRSACTPAVARSKERPVIIEGSDPNIAKPLGVHHILPTVLGQCLTNLYRHAGYNVLHWNYIGDWGTQFGHLAVAVKRWGTRANVRAYSLDELLHLYVRFHEEAAEDPTLEDQGREAFRTLERGDPALRAFWSEVVAITSRSLAVLYERLHVAFDVELGESFYNDKVEPILEEGIRKGVFTEGERGALIVVFPEDAGLPVSMVRRADGATLYITRDLAQMRYRIDTYHPIAISIPTDVSQTLHFQQLIATCRLLGWELPAFEHVVFGRMRFKDKAMSTRKGTVLKLEEVLDEAVARAAKIIAGRSEIKADDPGELAEIMGIGALVYGILSQNRKMDIVFDWDRMLSFEGNSAPYLQYTHARVRSVLRKAGIDADRPRMVEELSPEVSALAEHERVLLRTLLEFPGVLEEARHSHMPHTLTHYLYELCQQFNAFYNVAPILKAEGATRDLRLLLTESVASVLKTGTSLLTLCVPERM